MSSSTHDSDSNQTAGEIDLCLLWNRDRAISTAAAESLFTSNAADALSQRSEVIKQSAQSFLRSLTLIAPELPSSSSGCRDTVISSVRSLLQDLCKYPSHPFTEEYIDAALWPIYHLRAGELAESVCDVLTEYCIGIWAPHLTKPQLYTIERALSRSLAALPFSNMDIFWVRMQSSEEHYRSSMLLGLGFLSAAHAVQHLIYGLSYVKDHSMRREILFRMEEIADPRCLPVLIKMRSEAAYSDWTLARLIIRVIRVIEMVNRDEYQRTLLRPSETTLEKSHQLLHPADGKPDSEGETDNSTLLRPSSSSD